MGEPAGRVTRRNRSTERVTTAGGMGAANRSNGGCVDCGDGIGDDNEDGEHEGGRDGGRNDGEGCGRNDGRDGRCDREEGGKMMAVTVGAKRRPQRRRRP